MNRTPSTIKKYYISTFQHNANQYIKGRFDFCNSILLLICFVKDGIPIEFLQSLSVPKLTELLNKQFIIQKYGYIYPNFERWNNHIPGEFIDNCKSEIVNYIFELIKYDCNRKEIYQCALMVYYPEYYNKYFEDIFDYVENQFKENKYSSVIFLCEALTQNELFYSGDPEKMNYVKYYLAFSYMHCDASKNAYSIFRDIVSDYQFKAKSALYFDAESELIDAKFWGFSDFKLLPCYINNFRKEWKISLQDIPDLHSRSYLTATNRMMVTYLALDRMDLAQIWFKKNIKLAITLNEYEHLGYTYMDYAKGIYHTNLSLALKYLEIADTYFHEQSEYRRHLDCQCEIQYIKFLLGKGSLQQLLTSQELLFENQYFIQYYKCHLKLATCYLVRGEYSNARKSLLEAEASAVMQNDERVKYLCSILGSFLYKEAVTYENGTLADTSYQKILDNNKINYNHSKVGIYNIENSDTMFYLDPRAW